MFSNLKIGHKLAAAFGFLVLISAAVGGLAISELRAIEVSRNSLIAQTSALGSLREAKLYMARQENSFRGFVISQDPYYLERLASHRENYLKNLADAADF